MSEEASSKAGYPTEGETWSTKRRWDRCGLVVGKITHGGPVQYCTRPKPCSDHQRLEHLQKSLNEATDENTRLRKALDDIYPWLAARVINLQEAGEDKAAESWNRACHIVIDATRGKGSSS